jgi:ketosteroid isomerase-like protein
MKPSIPFTSFLFILGIILFVSMSTPAQAKADPVAEVKATLDAQVTAWNVGAAENLNSVYYDSPEMLWVNRTGIRKGIAPVQASYRRASASNTPPAGVYSYEALHTERLSPTCVYFVIKWKYEQRGRNALNGVTSMVWKKINKKWVIVAEHAS